MEATSRVLEGKRIGLFGKGGAGKSTTTVLLAQALRSKGYKVCILDADSTNVGTHQALGVPRMPSAMVDYFGGMVFLGGTVACPVENPAALPGATIELSKLPDTYIARDENGVMFLMAGKLADYGIAPGCDGPMTKIARDLAIADEDAPPVMLVDCKAGYEDSARGIVTGLDWALVVVDPTTAALHLAMSMTHMGVQMRLGALPATRHMRKPERIEMANAIFRQAKLRGVLAVLNKVQDEAMCRYMESKLREAGVKPIGVIHNDPALAAAWMTGDRLAPTVAGDDALKLVEQLESAAGTPDA